MFSGTLDESPFFALAAAFSSLILSVLIPANALSKSRICWTSEVEVDSFNKAFRSSLNFPSFSWGRINLVATVFARVSKSLAVLGSKVFKSISCSPPPPKASLAAFKSACSWSLHPISVFRTYGLKRTKLLLEIQLSYFHDPQKLFINLTVCGEIFLNPEAGHACGWCGRGEEG